jgi:hypothetical protein
MARRKAKPKATPKATAEDQALVAKLFSGAFSEVMMALTSAKPVEPAYARFRPAAKQRTKEERTRIADLAGQYVAERAGPDPSRLTQEEYDTLSVKALDYALGQLEP